VTAPEPADRPDWEPVNDVERALLAAAAPDHRRGYFQLIAAADLYLPQIAGDTDPEQRFLTVHAFDQVFLPVFTSVAALAAQFGHAVNGYTVTTIAELQRKWPDPQWRLAINPGTPVDAYLSVESFTEAAMGDVVVPTMAELVAAAAEEAETEQRLQERYAAGSYPHDDPAAALRAAAQAGDVYGYLDRLLDTVVLVPTTRPVPAEAILELDFPWRPGPDRMIEVFTNREALERTHPEPVPAVEVALPFALAVWPEQYGISVNPGDPDGIVLAAEEVPWLLSFQSGTDTDRS
jgi:hypothetical protein